MGLACLVYEGSFVPIMDISRLDAPLRGEAMLDDAQDVFLVMDQNRAHTQHARTGIHQNNVLYSLSH